MRNALPIRAVTLLVVAVFGVHLSRFYLVADLTDFNCPHHVQSMDTASQGATQHANHAMPPGKQSHTGTHPGKDNSGMRCCCRHTLDGLISTLVLYRPADLASVPTPDGIQAVSLAAEPYFSENDPNPPFQPPRV